MMNEDVKNDIQKTYDAAKNFCEVMSYSEEQTSAFLELVKNSLKCTCSISSENAMFWEYMVKIYCQMH